MPASLEAATQALIDVRTLLMQARPQLGTPTAAAIEASLIRISWELPPPAKKNASEMPEPG